MKKIVTTNYWKVDQTQARNVFKKHDLNHTYGEASSVSCLAENSEIPPSLSRPYDIGVVDMKELGLFLDDTFTMKDVLEKCKEKGYEKPVFSDIINYLDMLGDLNFQSRTAIMSIMDEVLDCDQCPGRVYLQPDESGFLCKIGFIKIDESKTLSKTARFLVKK